MQSQPPATQQNTQLTPATLSSQPRHRERAKRARRAAPQPPSLTAAMPRLPRFLHAGSLQPPPRASFDRQNAKQNARQVNNYLVSRISRTAGTSSFFASSRLMASYRRNASARLATSLRHQPKRSVSPPACTPVHPPARPQAQLFIRSTKRRFKAGINLSPIRLRRRTAPAAARGEAPKQRRRPPRESPDRQPPKSLFATAAPPAT